MLINQALKKLLASPLLVNIFSPKFSYRINKRGQVSVDVVLDVFDLYVCVFFKCKVLYISNVKPSLKSKRKYLKN